MAGLLSAQLVRCVLLIRLGVCTCVTHCVTIRLGVCTCVTHCVTIRLRVCTCITHFVNIRLGVCTCVTHCVIIRVWVCTWLGVCTCVTHSVAHSPSYYISCTDTARMLGWLHSSPSMKLCISSELCITWDLSKYGRGLHSLEIY